MLEGRMTRMKSGDLSLFIRDLTVLHTHFQEWKGEMFTQQYAMTKKTSANHLDYSCMVDSFALVLLLLHPFVPFWTLILFYLLPCVCMVRQPFQTCNWINKMSLGTDNQLFLVTKSRLPGAGCLPDAGGTARSHHLWCVFRGASQSFGAWT